MSLIGSAGADFRRLPRSQCVLKGVKTLQPGLSAIVPVYNNAQGLPQLLASLKPALTALGRPFEILLVNDGSRDHSWQAICELAGTHPEVRGIDMMRNFGQHNALLCGIRAASYEVAVTLDDDLQNPPEEIHKLLARLEEGVDVVYGTPAREQHGLFRDLASQITKLALQASMGVQTARKVSAFRAFRTQLRDAFDQYAGPFVSIDVLLTWGTTSFDAVTVRHDARQQGVSGYTFRKLVVHAMNMITGFSTTPLRIASMVGFGFTMFGFVVLAYVLASYLRTASVAGFPFLASIIAIFSGAQLFALGILGEYLARMHFRLMDRPPYAVRTLTPESRSEPAES